MSDDFEARVERAAMAWERELKSCYGWSEELFQIWWNKDSSFVKHVTAWPDGFRGTHKGHLFHQVRIILRAADGI